ncbi:hypothetical protein [Flammeovirga sp. SJP92]|uniref:hypothetical protein n=1 Tax=Flammeovirga sp. SJP92 TaxID=1775430 RepID=UPI000786FC39|nr:hypothetical protein [Flammeovirga sp. SJP92]KXX72612.1 hypothetical protein AVL50_06315 [Flammeovirga sp. SJP92]
MKKKIRILLYFSHLLLIFFHASWATFDAYLSFYHDKSVDIPVISLLKQNQHTDFYYVITGINTGYGFYGIHTSTEKYFRAYYLDSTDNVLKTDRYFNLSTSNGISRLEGFASFFSNYVADTDKLIKSDTTSFEDENPKTIRLREHYNFRKDYVAKVLKWYGKNEVKNMPKCDSYKIELLTLVPQDIWQKKKTIKPQLYVVQEGQFPVQ